MTNMGKFSPRRDTADNAQFRSKPLGLLWALILAVCGGGGGNGSGPTISKTPSSLIALSGRAINGPVEGGRVYVDINGNGNIDDAERQNGYVGMTDGSGHYSGQVNSAYHDRMTMIDLSGATDHGSNLDDPEDNQTFGQNTYWRALPGSTILSPLTEILVRIYGVNASATDKATFAKSRNL